MPSATSRSARRSAGLLLFRTRRDTLQILLGHPGGPFFANKDDGHWTVLKGELEPDEEPIDVARREFAEETGHPAPSGPLIALGEVRQRSGKLVQAWAAEGDLDPAEAVSNTFELEWPPRSGKVREFPEIDRVAWFDVEAARAKIIGSQAPFLDRLREALPNRD